MASATQMLAVLQTLGSAVVLLDAGGIVRLWNKGAENTLGIPSHDALGRDFSSLAIGWDWESLGAVVPGFVSDRTVRLDEIRLVRPDGRQAVLAFTVAPLSGLAADGCLWHGADITERQAMESQLRHAQKLESIGGLAAGIAHEINTPMQFIGDNTRFLSDAFTGIGTLLLTLRQACETATEEQRAAIAAAERSADLPWLLAEVPKALAQSLDGIERVSRIVKAMKEFSHPGVDEAVPTDLNHAIEGTLTVSRNVWKYVADVDLRLASDLPLVPVVPGGFNQVVLNLVVNAAQAIEDSGVRDGGRKGVIAITTRQVDGRVVVEVRDSGCGIPAHVKSRMFDPFFTTKEPGRGTGQGLAIVHSEIVDRLGGRIEVDSEPGQGATFRLLLPLQTSTTAIRRRRATKGTP